MAYSDFRTAPVAVARLMDVAGTLADLTESLELTRQIPAYLTQAMGFAPLTLAIIADGPTPTILIQASSGALENASEAIKQNLLSIHQQTKPLSTEQGPAIRDEVKSAEFTANGMAQSNQHPALARALVFARGLDARHRMLLIVLQSAEEAPLSSNDTQLLQLVADQLAKFLACLTAWYGRSEELGMPFNRLTEREWMVLRGLTSEQGEKQLADELSLSPHTLHSHIKSIYRKTGVQGRLVLMGKVKDAMRTMRKSRLGERRLARVPGAAVAVG